MAIRYREKRGFGVLEVTVGLRLQDLGLGFRVLGSHRGDQKIRGDDLGGSHISGL